MQISAANLLLAAQQPRATNNGSNVRTAFAAALNESAARLAETAASFALPDFEAGETGAEKPSEPSAAAAESKPATGPDASAVPGTHLDIRV